MSARLDPRTAEKIEEFGRRRRRLIILRGTCASVTAWLVAMTVVAALDYLTVLEDYTRLALSLTAYASVGLVLYITCLRRLWHKPDSRELARLLEATRPELREDLLSAVELGETETLQRWNSEIFRTFLQEDVAARVRPLPIISLLPGALIVRWVRVALVAATVSLVLMAIPGLRYTRLMLRAVMPMANIDRISRVKIRVIEPDPAEAIVPQGDLVSVVAELAGAEADEAYLESFSRDEGTGRALMRNIGKRRYSASIQVGREAVRYRIRAGDGLTRKYTLNAFPRPHVKKFVKTYRYPKYAQLPEDRITEQGGDIEALENTTVDLVLEVDQPVKEGELRMETADEKSVTPLEAIGPRTLTASIPLKASGTYRVHLVAETTGFENKFSPEYEIRAKADLLPVINIDKPGGDLIVPPDDVVRIEATANDDLALASVAQIFRINYGKWITEPILEETRREKVKIRHNWDLYTLGVKPGDRVLTKFVATDLKGNRGESIVLRLTVSSPGFDPDRLKPLRTKRRAHEAVKRLSEAAKGLERLSNATLEEIKKAPEDKLARKQALSKLTSAAEEVRRQAAKAQDRVKDAIRDDPFGAEAEDLVLLGRMVSRLEHGNMERAKSQIQRAGDVADAEAARKQIERTRDLLRDTAKEAGSLKEAFDSMLAAEEADAVAQDLKQLAREQDRIAELADDSAKQPELRDRVARRQDVAVDHTKTVEDMMKTLSEKAGGQAGRIRQIEQDLRNATTAMEKTLSSGPEGPRQVPRDKLDQMEKSIDSALAGMQPIMKELSKQADSARQNLMNTLGRSSDEIEGLRQDVKRFVQDAEKPQSPEMAEAAARTDDHWQAVADWMEDTAALEELRWDGDPVFVDDTAKTSDALEALRTAAMDPEQLSDAFDDLKNIDNAFRTLEAGHELAEMTDQLEDLAARERWDGLHPDQAIGRAEEWNRMNESLRAAEQILKEADISPDSRERLSDAAWGEDAKAVREEMAARQSGGRSPESVAKPLARMNDMIAEVRDEIQPFVDEARAVMEESAPSLYEHMSGLAQAAENMQEKTRELAATAADGLEDVREDARDLLTEQEEFNDQLETIRSALRRDADRQDLAMTDGRERARDADDALAMLYQPPPRAEDFLREASTAPEPGPRARALDHAEGQQEKLSDTLAQLADHYENLEEGRGEETRTALREAEEGLGIKRDLDWEYEMAEYLARMARQSPEETISDLEDELAVNDPMRQELDSIAEGTLDDAAQAVAQVAKEEDQLAGDVGKLAQEQADKNNELAEKAKCVAETAQQLAENEIPVIARDAKSAGLESQEELERAAESLWKAAEEIPADFSRPPAELAQKMDDAAKALREPYGDLDSAAKKSQQAFDTADRQAKKAQEELARAKAAAEAAKQSAQKALDEWNTAGKTAERTAQERAAAEKALGKAVEEQARQSAQKALADEALGKAVEELAAQSAQKALAQEALGKAVEDVAAQSLQKALDEQKAAQQAVENAAQAMAAAEEALKNAAEALAQATTAEKAASGAAQQAQKSTDAAAAASRNADSAVKAAREAADQRQQDLAKTGGKAASDRARNAAAKADKLAKESSAMAAELADIARKGSSAMDRTAEKQGALVDMAEESGKDIARAGRHRSRLGREDGNVLRDAGQKMQAAADKEMSQAARALEQAERAQEARPAVDNAKAATDQALADLDQARGREPKSAELARQSARPDFDSDQSDAIGRWLGRALDSLDQAQDADESDGRQARREDVSDAASAMMRAARAQSSSMAAARRDDRMTGQTPGGGTQVEAAPEEAEDDALAPVVLRKGDWGKLPKKLARDLMDAKRENVPEEYRAMVHTYFRVIAEKSKKEEE